MSAEEVVDHGTMEDSPRPKLNRIPVKDIPLLTMENNELVALVPTSFSPLCAIFGPKKTVAELVPYLEQIELQRLMQATARARMEQGLARKLVKNRLCTNRLLEFEVNGDGDVALQAMRNTDTCAEMLSSRPALVLVCEHCLVGSPRFRCALCNLAAYCQKSCQVSAWASHKFLCAEVVAHHIRSRSSK
jgi:hypothetical protein